MSRWLFFPISVHCSVGIHLPSSNGDLVISCIISACVILETCLRPDKDYCFCCFCFHICIICDGFF